MRDFTGWKYYTDVDGVNIGITFTHPNGMQESRLLIDSDVAAWIAAGNEPLPSV